VHVKKEGLFMAKRKEESYEAAFARMYTAYLEKPLKQTSEYVQMGLVTEPTLESVIERSQMGIQNPQIKARLKEYVIENEKILSIPTMDEEKRILVQTKRQRLAIRTGRYRAKIKRGKSAGSMKIMKKRRSKYIIERTRLNNYVRLTPFLALFSKNEIIKIEGLPYSLDRPRLAKNGQFTVRYKGKRLTQKQFVKLLK
jgi:hypothetical protein